MASTSRLRNLSDLCQLFLKLGATSFGGPAVHISMMEEEVVRKRRWLTHQEFLDLISITNLIPGPNSTELAIHIGYIRAGWVGLMVAGLSFIVPAMLIVLGCSWFYVRYGQIPAAGYVLYGIKPIVMAIVVQALWGLSKTAVRSSKDLFIFAFAVAIILFKINELMALFGIGLLAAFLKQPKSKSKAQMRAGMIGLGSASLATTAAVGSLSNSGIFLTFFKIGSVLFGSGYVLLAFLRADFVERFRWLTEDQLLDAVAIGQITPGPVFTTATFIGYLLNGLSGALVATAGIFLPAFVFVAISGLIVPHIRKSEAAGHFLDGLNLASLALMGVVSLQLGRSALVDPWTLLIAATALALLVTLQVNSVLLIVAGALIGLIKGFTI